MSEKEHKNSGPRIEDLMVVEKVESIIDRISGHKNVEGVIVCDKEGAAIQTTVISAHNFVVVHWLIIFGQVLMAWS